jgi:1-acyl-sn-glycerol-3-phosphate acyltransferase
MVHFFARNVLAVIVKVFIKSLKGKKNIPKDGPFIIASNHASFIDDFIVPLTILRKVNKKFHIFVNSRFYKYKLIKKFLDNYECIPVDVAKDVKDEKRRKKTNEEAFKKAINGLKKGLFFIIFPEGGRSNDGKLKKAKVGVARVALESKVKVLPVGIIGSYDIMPKGAKFPILGRKADIIIGKPMSFEKYYGKEKDYKSLREVTNSIMKEIARLTNQEYNH